MLAFECVVMGLGTAGEMHAAAFCEAEEVACIKQQEWKEEVSKEQDDAKWSFCVQKGECVGKKFNVTFLKTKFKKNGEGKCRNQWVVAQR